MPLRGINCRLLFPGADNDEIFLEALRECTALPGYKVFAYRLMGKPVLLLLRSENEGISVVMKRPVIRFVQRMTIKYSCTGCLFQDRHKSEAVSDDGHFLNLVRFIRRNPVKIGLAESAAGYSYSSHAAGRRCRLPDTGLLYSTLHRSKFSELMRVPAPGTFPGLAPKGRQISNQKAVSLIRKAAPVREAQEIQQLAPHTMDNVILLPLPKGVPACRPSRLTGIPGGLADNAGRWRKR